VIQHRIGNDTGRGTNPMFNRNRMKLGVFALNVSGGTAMTSAAERFEPDWSVVRDIVTRADDAGFEAVAPIARWKGFGGSTDFNGSSFEPYTWAASVAAVTKRIAVFSTSHVPTVHPIVAAKQVTTIDHVSGGRFVLNVVCGWYRPELEMFGAPIRSHDEAYEYAAEWLEVMRRLWTDEQEFDFSGRFISIRKGFHQPKPIQRPFPPIMNAGGSPVGRRFAAVHADIAFTYLSTDDLEATSRQVSGLRQLARERFGRELQVWIMAYVVCRPTTREARDYLHHYVEERGDWDSARNFVANMNMPRALPRQTVFNVVAGSGGQPLVGTPAEIVERLVSLSRAGIDGCLLSWVDYRAGVEQWAQEVMPLLEQAGLRGPAVTSI
jgi:alkanesulfonate monooxygenase SsuD/methylene tetrahydromethanopterin reductase-like flavin-dependent oxidoreductase (luciferase family)